MAFSLHTLATLLPFLSLLAPTLSLPQTQPTVEYWTIKDLALTLTNVSDSHPAIDIITNPYINKSLSFEVDMSGTFKVVQCDRKLYLWACRVGDGMGSDGNVMQKKKGMKDNDDEEEKEIIVVHVTLGQMDGSVERMQGDDKMVDRKKISDKKTNAMHQDDEDKMGLYIEVSRIQGFADNTPNMITANYTQVAPHEYDSYAFRECVEEHPQSGFWCMFSDEAAAAKGGVVDRMGAVRGDTISNDMVDHIKAMMQDGDKRTEMVHSTDMDGKRMDGEHMDDGAQMAHMPVMDWAAKVRACNALGMPDMFHCVDTMWQ